MLKFFRDRKQAKIKKQIRLEKKLLLSRILQKKLDNGRKKKDGSPSEHRLVAVYLIEDIIKFLSEEGEN